MVKTLVLSLVIAVAACGKSSSSSSGGLSGADRALLHEIPGGNVALFGGNVLKMQDFMQSKMGRAIASTQGEQQQKWMACFDQLKDLRVAGALAYTGGQLVFRIVFSGMKPSNVADCAKQADFKSTLDPDGKFVSVDIAASGMQMTQGYLQLPSGDLYMRMGIELGLAPTVVAASRADLEADAAATGKSNAAGDDKLVALVSKVDKSKTFWFVGNAAGTPLASKVGELYGTFDLASGVAVDVTVQLANAADADKIEHGIQQAKSMADKLPPDLKSIITNLDFSRSGDHVHFAAKATAEQLQGLMSMGGMGLR